MKLALIANVSLWFSLLYILIHPSSYASDIKLANSANQPNMALLMFNVEIDNNAELAVKHPEKQTQQYCDESQLDCDVLDPEIQIQALVNGGRYSNLNSANGDDLWFKLKVPEGAGMVSFAISGGIGDADMYVKFNRFPTDDVWDCRPMLAGNEETCELFDNDGIYFIRIKSFVGFAALSITVSYGERRRMQL